MAKNLQTSTLVNFNRVIDLMLYWAKKLWHPDNIAKWIKPWIPLTMWEAVKEIWMSLQNFIYIINAHPNLKDRYEEIKILRREKLRLIAEDNIDKWLSWQLDITDDKLLDYSFRLMEKTSKEYNPKVEVDANIKKYMLDMTDEELLNKIKELADG